jgi:hypothetical protein
MFRSYCDVAAANRLSAVAIFAAISSNVSAAMLASWQQSVDAAIAWRILQSPETVALSDHRRTRKSSKEVREAV